MRALIISIIAWQWPGLSRLEPLQHLVIPEGHDGGTKEIIGQSQVWKGGEQARRICDATKEERNPEIRKGRKRRQGKEPQASDRYRIV